MYGKVILKKEIFGKVIRILLAQYLLEFCLNSCSNFKDKVE